MSAAETWETEEQRHRVTSESEWLGVLLWPMDGYIMIL